VKNIVFAALITAFLAVGAVALTFAFRSPAPSPRLFTLQELQQEENVYRTQVVTDAEAFIISTIGPLLGQITPQERERLEKGLTDVKALLGKLGRIPPQGEIPPQGVNNKIVENIVAVLKGVETPQLKDALSELADQYVKQLEVRWEPNMEKMAQGRLLYRVRCSTCHGADGTGNPITPEGLAVSPRDFTGKSHSTQKVVFKFNTSDRPGMLALDEDLKETIRNGLPGTPMPGFSTLSDAELDALLEYVKAFGYVAWKFNQPTRPALQTPPVPADLSAPRRVDAGRALFANRGCTACHGDIEKGGQPIQGLVTEWLKDGEPVPVMPRNFASEPLRRPGPDGVFKTIRLGVKGTPMPANPVSDEETWNLVAYVLHLKQLSQAGKVPAR
jgi:mono/diheme cytochrome c family protein